MREKIQPISILHFYTQYLAHPAQFEEEGKAFQKKLEKLGLTVINPFEKERAEFKVDSTWKPEDWWTKPHSPQEAEHIVERDLEWIRKSDSLVAFIPEPRGFGTMMEIFYAAKLCEKPVFIYTSKTYRFHPWLMHFGQVFTDKTLLFEVLKLRQRLEGVPFRIAIGGKMGTGKSSLADFLVKCFQFKKYSFAAKLKKLASDLFDMEIKDRELLQILGTKVREVETDAWINYVIKQIEVEDPLRAVIDDMRYLNEAEILRKKGFELIKLHTPKSTVAKRGITGFSDHALQHPSEVEIDAIDADVIIDTSGTLEQAYEIMMGILAIEEFVKKVGSCWR